MQWYRRKDSIAIGKCFELGELCWMLVGAAYHLHMKCRLDSLRPIGRMDPHRESGNEEHVWRVRRV